MDVNDVEEAPPGLLKEKNSKFNEEKDKEEEFQDNPAYLLKSQQTGWNILKAFVQETPEKLATAYAGIFGYI